MAYARQFSVLLLSKCDRLARNLLFSVTTAHDLKEQHGIMLRSVTEPIDTASPMGAIVFLHPRELCRRRAGSAARSPAKRRKLLTAVSPAVRRHSGTSAIYKVGCSSMMPSRSSFERLWTCTPMVFASGDYYGAQ